MVWETMALPRVSIVILTAEVEVGPPGMLTTGKFLVEVAFGICEWVRVTRLSQISLVVVIIIHSRDTNLITSIKRFWKY